MAKVFILIIIVCNKQNHLPSHILYISLVLMYIFIWHTVIWMRMTQFFCLFLFHLRSLTQNIHFRFSLNTTLRVLYVFWTRVGDSLDKDPLSISQESELDLRHRFITREWESWLWIICLFLARIIDAAGGTFERHVMLVMSLMKSGVGVCEFYFYRWQVHFFWG